MSVIKNKNHILATIDHLRSRKSRPDINRICKYMLKSYKVSPKDTKADLQRCVKENIIVKVDYKDNVSYRNAAKWRTKSSKFKTAITTAAAPGERRIITSAIATLIYQDQKNLDNGIAFEDLVKSAASQESKFSKKQLENIIHKEIITGSLVKLPNGNLALGPADHDADSSDSFRFEYNADSNTKLTSSANSSTRSSPQRTRGRPKKNHSSGSSMAHLSIASSSNVRVGERRKMAKKVFDPSDNNVPSKRKRGRPVGSLNKSTLKKRMIFQNKEDKEGTPHSESQHSLDDSADDMEPEEPLSQTSGGVCSVCLNEKSNESNEKMIGCKDCSNKAHWNCIQSVPGMLKLRPDNTWQCPHCKTCVVCCETTDAGLLTVCSICCDSYHALCHEPQISARALAWDQWECNNCLESRPTVVGSPAILPRDSPISISDPFMKPHEIDRKSTKSDGQVDDNIPDISDWTADEVHEYFQEHFPEAAPMMKEQDFDGQTLSVARRADIVKGLGLPLGPALALYRIVVKLQTRKDDWRMCWG